MTVPPDRRHSPWTDEAAQRVVAANGEWVLVASQVRNNVAWRIKTGSFTAFRPAGRFDAMTRRASKGSVLVDVYARLAQPE